MNDQLLEQEGDQVSAWLKDWANKSNGVWDYFNYGDQVDFQQLWFNADSNVQKGINYATKHFIIDWNGFPGDHRSFPKIVEFITPLDWALALTYDLVETNPQKVNLPQVVIVDRCSHYHSGSFAIEMRRALVDALHNIKMFSALGGEKEDPLALFEYLHHEENDKEKSDSVSATLASTNTPRLGQLRALRQAWIGYTVQSRDHHDINNLLGSIALGQEPALDAGDSETEDILERALFSVAKLLNLVDFEDDLSDGWALDDRIESLATTNEPVAAILIDDQATRWAGFLKSAFSGGNITVYEESDPTKVLNGLANALESGPFERCMNIDERKKEKDQILFLDLRFFPRGGTDERTFLTKVCECILLTNFECKWQEDSHFIDGPLSVLDQDLLSSDNWKPAKPFEGIEGAKFPFLQSAKRILECPQISWKTLTESRLYDHLLTLFPRFIAQVLYTTPIVLFSSTGRRDLTERFKWYRNIITVFEKPRLPVSHEQVARSFRLALDEATQFLAARRRMRQFAIVKILTSRSFPSNRHYYVELFIDEYFPGGIQADPRHIWVGGFYAIFDGCDLRQARNRAQEFNDELVKNGFNYFTRDPFGPSMSNGIEVKDKKEPSTVELRKTLESGCKPFKHGLVRIKCDQKGVAETREASGDNAYRQALAVLIESFLYEVMVHCFDRSQETNVSVAIFAGTRVSEARENDPDAMLHAREAAYRWGFSLKNVGNGSVLLESLVRSTLYPVIAELRELRGDLWMIERAQAVRMIYDYDPNKEGPSYEPDGRLLCNECLTTDIVSVDRVVSGAPDACETGNWLRVNRIGENKGKRYAILYPHDEKIREICKKLSVANKNTVYLPEHKFGDFNFEVNDDLRVMLNTQDQRGVSVVNVIEARCSNVPRQKGIAWLTKNIDCPSCGTTGALRPDYPGGLYIADEIVDKDWKTQIGYMEYLSEGPLGFDDYLDPTIRSLINAGRAADAGDRVEAALQVAVAWQPTSRSLANTIVERLAPTFATMSGAEFARFALNLGDRGEPADVRYSSKIRMRGFCTDLSKQQVKRIVEKELRVANMEGGVKKIVTFENTKRQEVLCEVRCSEEVARWILDTMNSKGNSHRPWRNAWPKN